MPKMKTNRGAAKRFRKTGGSVVRRAKAFRRHILTKKSSGRKRSLRRRGTVDATNIAAIERLLPN